MGNGLVDIGDADGPGGADGRLTFVAVLAAGLRLAVPLAAVRAVIRTPGLVRVPLSPPSLDGLAHWHGEAVPVIALGRALGRSDAAMDEAGGDSRLVLLSHRGQTVGLRVDGMAGMLRAEPDGIDAIAEQAENGGGTDAPGLASTSLEPASLEPASLEPASLEPASLDPAILDGVLRDGAVTILNPGALIDRQFGDLAAGFSTVGTGRVTADRQDRRAPEAGGEAGREMGRAAGRDEAALLLFAVAGQDFALPVDRVREVLTAPEGGAVARMARAKAHLLGVIPVRGRLVPLVDLGALFGLAASRTDGPGGGRVVVMSPGAGLAPVGLLVDEVREILRIGPSRIDPVPPLLAREPEFADVDGIARAGDGGRLVSVLSAERLFRHGVALGDGRDGADGDPGMSGGADGAAGGMVERFVVFRLAGTDYGLPVAAVREVLRRPDMPTPLPNAPAFVAGVLPRRGEVLPLIDLRRLLDLPPAASLSGGGGRVVVVGPETARAGGQQGAGLVGLLVDGLPGLIAVPADRIGPAPVVSEAQRRLIGRIARPDGGPAGTPSGAPDGSAHAAGARLILLMEPAGLLDTSRPAERSGGPALSGVE